MKKDTLNNDIFNKAHNGIAIVGLKGEWLDVNDSICNLLGYKKDELQMLTFQDITHPDDLNKDLQLLQKTLDGSVDNYQMEKRYLHKSGQTVWALLSVAIIRDPYNKPLHFISQIIDISTRKKSERESKEYLNLLVDQNNKFKSFVEIVNHDLRTHIGNLSTISSFIEDEDPALFETQNYKMLKQAILNLNSTLKQINNTIYDDSLTQNKLVSTQVSSLIDSAYKSISGLAITKKVTLINEVATNLFLKTEPAYLNSILFNFITNAIKYSSPQRDSFIKISSRSTTDFHIIDIEDNGLGIDLKKNQKRLFQPNATFHNNEDARGIGLFITKKHIELLGGSIIVESNVNVGSTFTLSFPKKD